MTTLADRMARVLRQDVQSMHAYAVQPSAGLVKLDTMENPYRLPPALRRALGERLGEVAMNRYPAERGDGVVSELYLAVGFVDALHEAGTGNGTVPALDAGVIRRLAHTHRVVT